MDGRTGRLQIEKLREEFEHLKDVVRKLDQPGGVLVPITTLAPEPYDVLKPIYAVVQPADDEYIAAFFDANVNAGGSNEVEAVDNLKDVMIGLFDYLNSQPAKKLGPAPTRQLAILRGFLRRRE
jgi:hypothetical protein